MSCATYFSPFDISGSSMETEIGWSSYCIPNAVKLAVFIVLLVSNFAIALAAFFMVIQQRHLQLLKRLSIALISIGCFANTGVYGMHIAGVQSPARYLLFPVFTIAMVSACCIMMSQWYETISGIARPGHVTTPKRRLTYSFIALISLGYLILNPVLAMVYYEDPIALNWVYSFMICYNGITGVALGVTFIFLSYGLMKACKPAEGMENTDMLNTVFKKLRHSVIMGLQSTIFSLGLMCFPVWMHFTSTATDAGLQGHFYFQFVFTAVNHTVCAAFGLWVLSKSASTGGKTSSTGGSVSNSSNRFKSTGGTMGGIKERDSSFTFTVDDLTNPV